MKIIMLKEQEEILGIIPDLKVRQAIREAPLEMKINQEILAVHEGKTPITYFEKHFKNHKVLFL